MPRNGSGVYSKPAGTTAVPNTVIESSKYNQTIDDLVDDANAARPITAGGTGATSKQGAIDGIFDGAAVIDDADLRISDPSDRTKIIRLDAGLVTTGTVRVLAAPDRDINISSVPRGHLYGLALSNNGTDATNDIDIAAGEAASDDTSPHMLVLSSALTKRLDAAWAVGTGNGGLDIGTIGNNTYHVWLIQRSDTGVVDALFSISATAPTMPANYDRKRRIGSIIRSGGTILGFSQNEDTYLLNSAITDRSSISSFTSDLLALTVPTGIVVQPIILSTQQQNAAGNIQTQFGSAGKTPLTYVTTISSLEVDRMYIPSGIFTNTSAQIQFAVSNLGGTLVSNTLVTLGWIDSRGH